MDYPYIFNFLIMLFLAYQYWKKQDPRLIKWAFILQFAFIALRAPVVGADTWDYVRYLAGERDFYNYDTRELEPLFIVYREILVALHCNRLVVMLINSFLSCYPLYLLVKRFSNNVPLSLAMLPILNFYGLYFVGLRQVLALAILIFAMLYVYDEKKRKWTVFVLLSFVAWNFHTSATVYAAIFVAAYFIKFKSRIVLISAVAISAVMGIVLQSFNVFDAFNFFLNLNVSATERIEGYLQEGGDTRDIASIIMSLRPSLIAIGVFMFIDKEKLNHWFSVLYAIQLIIANLFISVPMIGRLTGGFVVFGAIVFTWVLGNDYYLRIKQRQLVNKILIVFFLYFGQMLVKNNLDSNIDLTSADRMHPYYFIWEDYSDHPSIKYW